MSAAAASPAASSTPDIDRPFPHPRASLPSEPSHFSIFSWNVLADCYSRLGQFPYCPQPSLLFSSRLPRILALISASRADVLCLQEVDHWPDYASHLSSLGYTCHYAQRGWPHPFFPPSLRSSASLHLRATRKADGICIAWRSDLFDVVAPPRVLQLNDLAFVAPAEQQTRYWRHNIALGVGLQVKGGGSGVLVVCTHLYWSPLYEDVKVNQAKYILAWAEDWQREAGGLPLPCVLAGDFNSTPLSRVYQYITQGRMQGGQGEEGEGGGVAPRLLVEKGLFRLAKWLRSIGIDTAYQDDAMHSREEIQVFFDRAVAEKRVIITKSKSLCQRRQCPEFFLLPSTASWESMLAAVVGRFGLELIPSQFYTRCTLCNGTFETVNPAELGWTAPRDAPRRVVEEGRDEMGRPLTFFRCLDCAQVYWWGSKSHDTANKFRSMFDRLTRGQHEAAEKDEAEEKDGKEEGKDGVGSEAETATEEPKAEVASSAVHVYVSTLSLASSLFSSPPHSHSHELHLRSAYADYHRQLNASVSSLRLAEPHCTNWTDKFCDTIDFIFLQERVGDGVSGSALRVTSVVPLRDEEELSTSGFLPNDDWPSDHLSLQVEVELRATHHRVDQPHR